MIRLRFDSVIAILTLLAATSCAPSVAPPQEAIPTTEVASPAMVTDATTAPPGPPTPGLPGGVTPLPSGSVSVVSTSPTLAAANPPGGATRENPAQRLDAASANCAGYLPEGITIEAPSSSLPPQIQAFSGAWSAQWPASADPAPSLVIVDKNTEAEISVRVVIQSERRTIDSIFKREAKEYPTAGKVVVGEFMRSQRTPGSIVLRVLSLTMNSDLQKLDASLLVEGGTVTSVMTRCQVQGGVVDSPRTTPEASIAANPTKASLQSHQPGATPSTPSTVPQSKALLPITATNLPDGRVLYIAGSDEFSIALPSSWRIIDLRPDTKEESLRGLESTDQRMGSLVRSRTSSSPAMLTGIDMNQLAIASGDPPMMSITKKSINGPNNLEIAAQEEQAILIPIPSAVSGPNNVQSVSRLHVTFDGIDAERIRLDARSTGITLTGPVSRQIFLTEYVIVKNQARYIVSFIARSQDEPAYMPVFEQIVRSFRFSP